MHSTTIYIAHMYIYIYRNINMLVYLLAFIYMCIYTYTLVYLLVCIYLLFIYIHFYVCIICIYTLVYLLVLIDIHTYIYKNMYKDICVEHHLRLQLQLPRADYQKALELCRGAHCHLPRLRSQASASEGWGSTQRLQ